MWQRIWSAALYRRFCFLFCTTGRLKNPKTKAAIKRRTPNPT
jgi:hypothetical protein